MRLRHHLKFCFLFLLCSFFHKRTQAQNIDSLYLRNIYDRSIDFDETKLDSLLYYSNYIREKSAEIKLKTGSVMALRLLAIHTEMQGEYDSATVYYLKELEEAERLGNVGYEISALSDLCILYSNLKQPAKSKEMILKSLALEKKTGNIGGLATGYENLGAIYNELGMHDSSLYVLNEALRLARTLDAGWDSSTVYNNIGNVYFDQKQFSLALPYFQHNFSVHSSTGEKGSLWYDCLNLADVFLEMDRSDSALKYVEASLNLAQELKSRSRQSDSYEIAAKYFHKMGNYKKAYEYLQTKATLDTSLLNEKTNRTVATLQEKFNATKREQQNQLLMVEVDKQKIQNRYVTFLAFIAVFVAVWIGFYLYQNHKKNIQLQAKNELIQKQNDKLYELNYEKNSLISVVSHDLSGPFANIKMWTQILNTGPDNFTPEQKKAISRIESSTVNGEKLIRNILDVEKAETNRQKLSLENFDLKIFVEEMVNAYRPSAQKKAIKLHYDHLDREVLFMSDKQLVSRICENLISNAIKYTMPGKQVWVSVSDEKDAVSIIVRDEGLGIPKDELPNLFSKYSKISTQPTAGEASTGLGLSIVKRIVEELNGKITCESEPGMGSLFTVVLKK